VEFGPPKFMEWYVVVFGRMFTLIWLHSKSCVCFQNCGAATDNVSKTLKISAGWLIPVRQN
jgi:hypothetical protein